MGATASTFAGLEFLTGSMGAISEWMGGDRTKNAYDYNAAIADHEAGLIRQGASLNEYRQRKEMKSVVGSQIAGYGSSGVEFTGSPLTVIKDSMANAELEIAIGQFNSEMAARRKESEAKMGRYYGKEAQTAARISSIGSFLETAGDFASKQYVPGKTGKGKTKIGE